MRAGALRRLHTQQLPHLSAQPGREPACQDAARGALPASRCWSGSANAPGCCCWEAWLFRQSECWSTREATHSSSLTCLHSQGVSQLLPGAARVAHPASRCLVRVCKSSAQASRKSATRLELARSTCSLVQEPASELCCGERELAKCRCAAPAGAAGSSVTPRAVGPILRTWQVLRWCSSLCRARQPLHCRWQGMQGLHDTAQWCGRAAPC